MEKTDNRNRRLKYKRDIKKIGNTDAYESLKISENKPKNRAAYFAMQKQVHPHT